MSSPDEQLSAQRQLLGRKAEICVLALVALLPFAALVRLISDYGVNVPYGDEWTLLPLFAKCHDHQLTLADLFRQHNEHRIVFPKLIYLAFANWTHWNVKAEMFFSVLLAGGASAGTYFLLAQSVPGTTRKRLLLWALINLLIFAPVQAENWLWGFQLQVFIPNLSLTGCLALWDSRPGGMVRFGGLCLLATVASFSFGGGLLLWPVLAFYFFLRAERARWLIAWGAGFLLVVRVYFAGYERQPIAGPEMGNPLDYLVYFIEFLGLAVSRSSLTTGAAITAATIGAAALLVYVALARFCWQSARETRVAAAPWLALGAYAICSAALAAWTRVGGGPQQALNSRYATISLNLYVGLIGLAAVAAHAARATPLQTKFSRTITSAQAPIFAAILALSAVSFPAAIDHMEILRRVRLDGLAHLQFAKIIGVSDKLRNALLIATPVSGLMHDVDLADRLGLLAPPLRHSPMLQDGENQPQRSSAEFGRFDRLAQKDGDIIEASGWCFLPDRGEPATCVALAYKADGNWIAFALSEHRETRPDIVKEMRNRKYLGAGWRTLIHRNQLPAGATAVSAWAFDPAAGALYKLPGEFAVAAR